MRAGGGYVLPPETAIEADGSIDALHHPRGAFGKAPAPLRVDGGGRIGLTHGRGSIDEARDTKGSGAGGLGGGGDPSAGRPSATALRVTCFIDGTSAVSEGQ